MSFRASPRRRVRRTRPSCMSCGTLRTRSGRHRRKSRSRGCSPRSGGLCRSPGRRSWRAWTRTSEPPRSRSRPTTSGRSRTPPHTSRSRGRGTPSSWRKGPVSDMRVGILGSGLMGGKLGTIFARAGHEVVFSYAQSEEKLKRLAREAKGKARHGTPREAAQEADALLLAVHWSRINDVLSQAGDLSGKVVLTCSLPTNDDNTELIVAHTSSGAEELARMIPKARVVSAFNTVPSEVLFGVYEATSKSLPSLVYCGDDEGSKAVAAKLIRDVGFDP